MRFLGLLDPSCVYSTEEPNQRRLRRARSSAGPPERFPRPQRPQGGWRLGEPWIWARHVYRCGVSSPGSVFGADVLTEQSSVRHGNNVPQLCLRLVGVVADAGEGLVWSCLLARWWSGSSAFSSGAGSSRRDKGGLVCQGWWLVGEGSGHLFRADLASSPDPVQEQLGEHPRPGDRLRPMSDLVLDPICWNRWMMRFINAYVARSFSCSRFAQDLASAPVIHRQQGFGARSMQFRGRSPWTIFPMYGALFSGCDNTACILCVFLYLYSYVYSHDCDVFLLV